MAAQLPGQSESGPKMTPRIKVGDQVFEDYRDGVIEIVSTLRTDRRVEFRYDHYSAWNVVITEQVGGFYTIAVAYTGGSWNAALWRIHDDGTGAATGRVAGNLRLIRGHDEQSVGSLLWDIVALLKERGGVPACPTEVR